MVEKTCYPSLVQTDFGRNNKYIIALRDLFEKKDRMWSVVYNTIDGETDSLKKYKTKYLLQETNRTRIIEGFSNKQDRQTYLSSELFRVQRGVDIRLKNLPKTILRGFERNDIVANKIVTDERVNRLDIERFKSELISEWLRDIVYDTLISQCQRCFERCGDSTFPFTIKKLFIHDELRVITDSLKLGKVNIPSGNECFADVGTAYGGGILHYIIYPNRQIKLLLTNTELIDVADYDNDGNFEYIFFKSWFNNYGYIMYYDNFRQQVVNEWSYH